MFSREDCLKFKQYLQVIIDRPRTMEEQKCVRKDGKMWCDDWRIIEILKYYFNGPEMYRDDPPPNRLKNNLLWSKRDIVKEANEIYERFVYADDIINYLKKERGV